MKNLHINSRIVCVYDSIDEMPIVNFQKYNKFLLIDSGIGSDVDDIDSHITKIAKYINSNNTESAIRELQNMRQNLYMINSKISPKYLAFAALIHSIDGVKITDLSDDNLKKILDELNTVKHFKIIDILAKIKKKVETELEIYFPNEFVDIKEKEVYDKLKKRVALVLDTIIYDNDNTKEISAIDALIFGMYKPNIFIGCDSIEVKYDKQFENACLLISQKVNINAKTMSVLEFYNALENIKKQLEQESKGLTSNRYRKYGRI